MLAMDNQLADQTTSNQIEVLYEGVVDSEDMKSLETFIEFVCTSNIENNQRLTIPFILDQISNQVAKIGMLDGQNIEVMASISDSGEVIFTTNNNPYYVATVYQDSPIFKIHNHPPIGFKKDFLDSQEVCESLGIIDEDLDTLRTNLGITLFSPADIAGFLKEPQAIEAVLDPFGTIIYCVKTKNFDPKNERLGGLIKILDEISGFSENFYEKVLESLEEFGIIFIQQPLYLTVGTRISARLLSSVSK